MKHGLKCGFQIGALLNLSVLFTLPALANISGFSEVDRGLYRGGRPSTRQDFQTLKDLGVKTILSFESLPTSTWPEEKRALKNNIAFLNIRIFSFAYQPSNSKMIRLLETMQNESLKPIYVHCYYGRDRTGLAVGMYRIHVQNWTPEAAYQEMVEFGFAPIPMWSLYAYFKAHSALGSLTPSDKGHLREDFVKP